MDHGRTLLSEPLARPGDRPVPGYCLVTRRGWGGFGEVWEAEAAGGFRVALKMVRLPTEARSAEVNSLTVVRGIRHPNLLVSFGAWQEDGVLIVGMELADRSLWDRFIEAEDQGLRGIPRSELLGYLWDVASGIDHLNEPRHTLEGRPGVGVQHRDLKPQNILLFGGGAKVADFGEAQVMDGPVAPNNGTWTIAYAAPEFFDGFTSHRSDQYALAVTYCQLRGGKLPYFGTDVTVTAGHLLGTPDLEGLPEAERPILARALSKRPEDRWPSCSAMIEALRALGTADGLSVPETLYGPPARHDDFRLRGSSCSGELSGATTPLDSRTLWDEDELDAEGDSGDDFELVSLDHFDVHSMQPAGPASQTGPVATPMPSAEDGPAARVTHGGSSPRIMVSRAAVALVTAGLLLAVTEARMSAGKIRLNPHISPPIVPAPRTGSPEILPGPEKIAHEVMRPSSSAPSTVAEVLRPPSIVTSTVAGDDDDGSIRPDRPDAAPVPTAQVSEAPIVPARSAHEVTSGASLFDDEPVPPAAEEIATMAGSISASSPMPSGERVFGLPDVVNRDLSGPETAPPALELPGEVRVRAGESTKLRVRIDRNGGSMPATLRFEGTPRGVSVGGLAIPAGRQETEVVVYATSDAPPSVEVVGVSAEVGDRRAEARVRLSVLPSAASEAYSRGREFLARRDWARAIEQFSEAIKLDPGHARAYCFRAIATHVSGNPRDALADYTEAIRLDPNIDIAYGARGRIRYEMGDLTRALADYDEAIRLKPGNAITLGARGRIYADLGQYDRALADFSEVIRLKPGSAEAHYLRGKTRYISGDNAGAVVDFTEAIKLDPTHAWAYRHRGDAFARLGNRPRADADRAMVDRLARPSARPVKLREDVPASTPPTSEAGTSYPGGTALSGPGLHQPTRRPTVSSAPANPQ